MKEQVKDVKNVCNIFYILCHISAFFLLSSTQNPLCTISPMSICYWFLKLIVSALFFTAGYNHGTPAQQVPSQELQELDWSIPGHHQCEVCEITQPYRTKHCEDCEACISKFDHHCFWLGSCVGELNHFRFTLYLVLESGCLWVAFSYCFWGNSLLEYFGYFWLGATCLGFGILTGGLGGFHVYLISIGATTWEVMRRSRISYLKPYPYNFHPFSAGCLGNWRQAMFMKSTKNWVLPRPMPFYPFNWCENEYWSCC